MGLGTKTVQNKLYPWQRECLGAWEEEGRRGIAHVVTGAGKTVMALEAIRRFRRQYAQARIRVVVPTIPLAWQWVAALSQESREPADQPGLFGAGRRDDPERPVMVYIINSARGALPAHLERSFSLGHPLLLICDECHHYQSQENRKIFDFRIPDFYPAEQYACLGLSATPFGSANDAILRKALGPEIYQYDYHAATRDGVVSPFTVVETAASFLPEERARYQDLSWELIILWSRMVKKYPWLKLLEGKELHQEVSRLAAQGGMDPQDPATAYLFKLWERKNVSDLALTRIQCALDILQALPADTRVIIFCQRISQAEGLLALIRRSLGSIAVLYHSKMSREARQRNLTLFKEGQNRVLISCRALDEGVDVPDAAVGIVVSSSAVTRQRIQRLGRVLRRSPGKAAASLYYIHLPESAEEMNYLPELQQIPSVQLRYDARERSFSNEYYEYLARKWMAKMQSLAPPMQKELRNCLLEGLPRTDYLLPEKELEQLRGSTVHERNYWKVMARMGRFYRQEHKREDVHVGGTIS